MHRDFLRLLEIAKGRSEYIIVVNLDIRGFTPFCQRVESVQVGTYITRVYLKIINDYFQNTSFYKPTGDGLIITMPYNAKSLKEVANSTVNSCLKLLQNFDSLLAGDPMINYSTPEKIGIGLTRGSACCITSKDDSEEKILDYSGRILNLASRLMDIARPSGLVLDHSFDLSLLPEETRELFSEEMVYLRGVAEEEPIKICYTKKYTLIPNLLKHPLKEPKWQAQVQESSYVKLKGLEDAGSKWVNFKLKKKPLDENKITVNISFDNPKVEGFTRFYDFSIDDEQIKYEHHGNSYRVGINVPALNKLLKEAGITDDSTIKFQVVYPVR